MTQALPIKAQRADEAACYQELNKKVTEGISVLTIAELGELEELYQLAINNELSPELDEGTLKKLAGERIDALQRRVKEGQPPFETTHFSTWTWKPEAQEYELTGTLRPLNAGEQTRITWKPKWVEQPNPYGPERTPQSRL